MSMQSDTAPKRLLVAEDDATVLELICTRLWLAGYEVFQARDGAQALTVLGDVRPAGIILDVNMPVLDGFGVLEHVKKTPALRTIPIMVLSARNFSDDVERALGLGARDYLMKPFQDQQLLNRVARLVRRSA
jgi:two-component system, chemotaxis family, chemotaxis protein CheY